jgi:cytochrome P450
MYYISALYSKTPTKQPANGEIKANLRVATPQEQLAEQRRVQAKGRLWQMLENIWDGIIDKINTIALCRFDPRTISGWYIDNDPYLSIVRIGGKVTHITKHKKVIEAIFKHHRNDSMTPFSTQTSPIIQVIKEYFPECTLQNNDCILLCNPEHTQVYRKFLNPFLTRHNVDGLQESITTIATTKIAQWQSSASVGTLNLTKAIMEYTCEIMAKLFLGHPGPYQDLVWAIKTTVFRISEHNFRRNLVSTAEVSKAKTIIRVAIEQAMQQNTFSNKQSTIVQAMQEKDFSPTQIQAMVLILFIAGQDTSAASITLKWPA